MKRLTVYLTVAAFTFAVGIFAGGTGGKNLPTTIESDCPKNSFTVENEAGAPAQLTLVKALCGETTWKASLNLENTGSKVIRGYEIENIESYEHKKCVKSSQGTSGISLEPGKPETLNFAGGFPSGLSYNKPTGPIQTNVFYIKHIEFADGTTWSNKKVTKE